jgi:inositol oxygenase
MRLLLALACVSALSSVVVVAASSQQPRECSAPGAGTPETHLARAETSVRQEPALRVYASLDESSRVRQHYKDMRTHQTMDYVSRMKARFGALNHTRMTIRQAFARLDDYVDASDPDMALPNVIHDFMTAESIRRAGLPDWMQLTGLLHDLGKLLFLWGDAADGMSGKADGPQWALGGDTWVMGEPLPSTAIFPEFNSLNPEHNISSVYPDGTGLWNLTFAFGHDEYAYSVLRDARNGCKLPLEALAMIRFHSCYPLHSSDAYERLLRESDADMLQAVREFNKHDLYSKADLVAKDLDSLWPYYESLMDKYFERGSRGELFF